MGDSTEATGIHTLTLRAEITILAGEEKWSQVNEHIPNELPVERFQSVQTYLSEVSGNVAVTLVTPKLPDQKIERVVRRTLSESEHARIALIATDPRVLLRCEVPHDDAFVLPDEADEFAEAIKHLYIRAYYGVTTDRYYKLSLAIKNHETRPADEVDSEKLQQLRRSCQRAESYLAQFRTFLDQNDFDTMKARDPRYSDLIESASTADPSDFNLPDSCPECDLDWTRWHGPRLRIGYEQIGANTWRCTDCGHIMADNDPDNYRVG